MRFAVSPPDGPLGSVTLEDRERASVARIASLRGGMATSFSVNGSEVFFLDSSTLVDVTKNVRGGNPVLFPTPGKLVNDRWSRTDPSGTVGGQLKQHGFGRNLAWTVASTSTDAAASATLALHSTDETLAEYPWAFEVQLTYRLVGDTLRIEQRVTALEAALVDGKSVGPMPFGFGFHPYFHLPQASKAGATITTNASRAFDNVAKKEIGFSSLDLAQKEVDLHLLDHGSNESTLSWGNGASRAIVRGSPEYTHWVVWTLEGKDFVCLEPWTCPGNAMNSGDRLMYLDPGMSRHLWIEIRSPVDVSPR